MTYKGYQIMATENATMGWPLDKNGDRVLTATPKALDSQSVSTWPEFWYSVVEDNFVLNSFETIEEAKEYIREEC